MIDQLVIGEKASFDDFGASLKERSIHAPSKKVIKHTVPFSNITYDFSAINGELYWEERKLQYIFEIIAGRPEELERKKAIFSSWLMNMMDVSIYDPFEPGWHYKGTFDAIDYDDDVSLEKTTITVDFSAYPYKIADNPTVYSFILPANSSVEKVVHNCSSHKIIPTLIADAGMTVDVEGTRYTLTAGTFKGDNFELEPGVTEMTITNAGGAERNLTIEFYEEVF